MGSCTSKPQKREETSRGTRTSSALTDCANNDTVVEEMCESETGGAGGDASPVQRTIGEILGGLSSHCGGGLGATISSRCRKVTSMAQSLLSCEVADVRLVEDEWIWFENALGKQKDSQHCVDETNQNGLNPLEMVPQDDGPIVINDLLEHEGYANRACVVHGPHVRFFAGMWLVSRENLGQRYGVLYLADGRRRSGKSNEDMISLMKELGDLLVGEIEKYKLELMQNMVQAQRSLDTQGSGKRFGPTMSRHVSSVSSRGSEESVGSLCAAADCLHGGVMLLESQGAGQFGGQWKILYLNDCLSQALGISARTLLQRDIWEFFSVNSEDRSAAYMCMKDHLAFEMSLTLQNRYHPNPETFTFEFKPASFSPSYPQEQQQQQQRNQESPVVGATNATRSELQDKYYFAIAKSPGMGHLVLPGVHQKSPLILSKDTPTVFKDIRLGPMIGRGAYGRVYRGNWNGNIVAVKVITSDLRRRSQEQSHVNNKGLYEGDDLSIKSSGMQEAAISAALSHPNVVHTYQYSVRHVEVSDKRASLERTSMDITLPKTPLTEIWLIAEFCNRGPLLTAIENGTFSIKPNDQYGQPNLIFILQTLQEISAAMEYLHSHDIVHGDLTGGNVLLTSSDKDGRGFTAKVVDFGLSRICEGGALKTSKMGCAEYMPPELITGGLLTKAGDVYAFGVILWELYNGKRAWSGMKPSDVLDKVAQHKILTFGDQTPRRLKILGERCMSPNPKERPEFSDIVFEVNSILSDTMCILQKFLGATNITRS